MSPGERSPLATMACLCKVLKAQTPPPPHCPLRHARTVWALITDDIGVLFIHGAVLIIVQKRLVGRSKGGAASVADGGSLPVDRERGSSLQSRCHHSVLVGLAERLLLFIHTMCLPQRHPLYTTRTKLWWRSACR